MEKNNSNISIGGVSFSGLLTILFVGLKLVHVISWSWWWVLSPLWIEAALLIIVICVVMFFQER